MPVRHQSTGADTAAPAAAPRPESLLLAFFGSHLYGRDIGVAIGSVIEVLSRLGVSEHAARATLKRMTQRGLLRNVRSGRHAYVSLTQRAQEVLRDGGARIDTGLSGREWDGTWTLLAFSVPERHRDDRHALRTQLGWAGFGMLRSGLWIAPSRTDVEGALARLGLLDYVKIFRAQALVPADPRGLAAEAWDVPALAVHYRGFVERWEGGPEPAPDQLCQHILLEAEWLLLIRTDPGLPLSLLPDGWPGIRAEELFRALRSDLAVPARELARATMDWMPLVRAARD